MMHGHSMMPIAQAAAVLLLTYGTMVRADNCAGGTDITGNECSGEQSARSLGNATSSPTKASRMVFVKREESIAQTRLTEAKLRQRDATTAVKVAEAHLIAARKAVAYAEHTPAR